MTLWNDLLGLQDELQRLLQTPGSFFREPSARGVFPPLNVFRAPDGLIVRAEIPGVEPGDVGVSMEGRRLTLTGERRPTQTDSGSYHRRERPYGKFSRTVTLPEDVDGTRATASLRDGVLTLTIPQHEAAKARRIEVTS